MATLPQDDVKKKEMIKKILALKERQMLDSQRWTAALAKATGYSAATFDWAEKKKYESPRADANVSSQEPSRPEYKSTLGQRPALKVEDLRQSLKFRA